MAFIQVSELLEEQQANLQLRLETGASGLSNKIRSSHIQKPGLALVGYGRHIVGARVQVFGQTEVSYLEQQKTSECEGVLQKYFSKKLCCCVITRDQKAPALLVTISEETGTPLLVSRFSTQEFINRLSRLLEYRFARRTSMHGVLMDVFGVGVLILGQAAIGKSECALDLILKGHRLVADDIVELRRIGYDSINGSSSRITKYLMEIRGLGIINIKEMFGIGAVRDKKRVHLVVKLVEWNEDTDYDRIGLDEKNYQILGVELPLVTVPVRQGRNLTAVVEVAARNHLLKMEGFHAAKVFQRRLLAQIAGDEEGETSEED